MPAFGLIPDSPWIYYGQKAFSKSKFNSRVSSAMSGGNYHWAIGKIKFRNNVLNFELKSPGGMVGRYLYRKGNKMATEARKQVGKKTGALARSIGVSVKRAPYGVEMKVFATDKKAMMHHEGTRPHVILPKNPGGILVFSKGTRVIRTARVMHPGTKPNRFLSDQLRFID